jgi:excisionase family DNA binding protein
MQCPPAFPEIMTPEQAAEYLQVSRETIYRYIHQGKLAASCLGRTYRIPKRNLELLLWENRTEQVPLRQYSQQEVAAFLRDDALDPETAQIAKRFLADDGNTARSEKEKQAA